MDRTFVDPIRVNAVNLGTHIDALAKTGFAGGVGGFTQQL
jgi:hypothetical protein